MGTEPQVERRRKWLGVAAAGVVIVFVVLVMTSVGGGGTAPNSIDGAFLTGMAPHHKAAIEMARIAETRADHREVRDLATKIASDQLQEIDQLNAVHQKAFGTPLPAAGGHGSLGLTAAQMGMEMDPSALRTAKPFDRAFIDMMVAHHQGAIRMARAELAQGSDPDTKGVARAVITAQSSEIQQMNRWRKAWFGQPSPAGGVPSS